MESDLLDSIDTAIGALAKLMIHIDWNKNIEPLQEIKPKITTLIAELSGITTIIKNQ